MSSERASAHHHAGSRARNAPLWTGVETDASADEPFVPEASGPAEEERSDPGRTWLSEVDLELQGANLDPEYWLSHCQGFLVDSESGAEVGVVDGVEFAPASDEPVSLIVASGWFGRHIRRIAVADVQAIVTSERRLIVKDASVRPSGGGHGRI